METATEKLLLRLKALADPVRLRLVGLCRHGECSVAELTQVSGQSQPRVSQQLKQLCAAGFLERFRDGKRVYYRVPAPADTAIRRLLSLIPEGDTVLAADIERLHALRGAHAHEAPAVELEVTPAGRTIHRALLDLTITAPLGDLLDIGCGRGRMLKLLASRANRAIGVDIDASARQVARAELMLAGLGNCSLRQGDMHNLPFADAEFDTVILDGVLAGSPRPVEALAEARRLLRPAGRLVILEPLGEAAGAEDLRRSLAAWSAAARLRLAPARLLPRTAPEWLLCVAISANGERAAA